MEPDFFTLSLKSIIAGFAALLLMIIPACEQRSVPDEFDLQGHRGASGLLPENTIPSFLKAIELGVNTVEFDVVISADSQVVISHEPWFRQSLCITPDGNPITPHNEMDYRIFEMTYDEISAFDCGMNFSMEHPDRRLIPAVKPLMSQAILEMEEFIRQLGIPAVRYSVEIKSRPEWDNYLHPEPETFARLVYEELRELAVLDRVILQSFDMRSLQYFRRLDPSVDQALLISRNFQIPDLLDRLGYVPEIFSPHYRLVTQEVVEESHRLGMKIIPWTVNNPADMERMLDYKVDGLITDYPDRFRKMEGRP